MYSTTYVTTGLQMYLLLVSRQIPIPPLVARTVVTSSFSFLHLCMLHGHHFAPWISIFLPTPQGSGLPVYF